MASDIAAPHSMESSTSLAVHDYVTTVLVDYDNVRPMRREQSTSDVADNLIQIREWVSLALGKMPIKTTEVELRIYGGWTDERGSVTVKGNWVLASLSRVRGLLRGVRYLPQFPVSIAARQLRLKGLFRTSRAIPEQKMVDTLIAVDAVHFSEREQILAIASDDDDIVPAALVASLKKCKLCCLLRTRGGGEAINDEVLEERGIQVIKLG